MLDFGELKAKYKKRRRDIRKEKEELVDKLSGIVSQMKKNVAEIGKIATVYSDFSVLLKETEFDKAFDLLKTNGFNNPNDIDDRLNELTEKGEELSKSYRNATNCVAKLKTEENEESIMCPECNGIGYTTGKVEFVETDTGRIKVTHLVTCTVCGGRRIIPTKELLDC